MATDLRVRHIYEHDVQRFEEVLNETIHGVVSSGGVIGDIKYASDPASPDNHRGGFGALIIFEHETDE